MAGKLGLDKYRRVAETQDETSVNQATRETMKLVQKSMDDKGKVVDPHEEGREIK